MSFLELFVAINWSCGGKQVIPFYCNLFGKSLWLLRFLLGDESWLFLYLPLSCALWGYRRVLFAFHSVICSNWLCFWISYLFLFQFSWTCSWYVVSELMGIDIESNIQKTVALPYLNPRALRISPLVSETSQTVVSNVLAIWMATKLRQIIRC